jgi:hypothetical protein
MSTNDRILELVRQKGPILPVHVSKEINDNILITSARLSELLSNKQISISHVKVGGSPLYYVRGQEEKLQEHSSNLANKEKEAYELIKKYRILRDSAQEPAIRVALRQIKDFTVPLQVDFESKTEIFWKWYLTDSAEAQLLIKGILTEEPVPEREHAQVATEQPKKEARLPAQTSKIKKEEKPVQKDIRAEKDKNPKNIFFRNNKEFFDKHKIEVLETNEIKRDNEFDFIVELETSIGNTKYFCKSKNKKKITESDLSTALLQSQSKGMPLLFLTNGKLGKRAKEMLSGDFKNILYKEI